MYLKHKKTGEIFCFNAFLEATGKYEKIESLPEAPAAETSAETSAKPATKPRAPKGK